GRLRTALISRVSAAIVIVVAEFVEALAGSWKHHHARAADRRRRGATGERERCDAENELVHVFLVRGLRRNALPPARALLDVRVVAVRFAAEAPHARMRSV